MWSNKPRKTYRLVLLLAVELWLVALSATAQPADSVTTQRGRYALVLTAGGGVSYYSTHLGVPAGLEQVAVSRFGVPATLRAMWFPDHRLRIGFETGRTILYSYRGTVNAERSRVRVSTVPVLLVFSMPLAWLSGTERSLARRLSVTGGTGAYVIRSRLDYAGIVRDNRVSIGWMVAGAYSQPITRNLRLASELKWYNATATEDAAFALQLQVVWRAFTW